MYHKQAWKMGLTRRLLMGNVRQPPSPRQNAAWTTFCKIKVLYGGFCVGDLFKYQLQIITFRSYMEDPVWGILSGGFVQIPVTDHYLQIIIYGGFCLGDLFKYQLQIITYRSYTTFKVRHCCNSLSGPLR